MELKQSRLRVNSCQAHGADEQNLRQVEELIREANKTTFNPVGLNVLSPRPVALQYVSVVVITSCLLADLHAA